MHNHKIAEGGTNSLGTKSCDPKIIGGEHDDELFASVAAYKVFGADTANQKGCGLAQDGVTSIVSVSIVELLEVIQIDHQQAKRQFGAPRRARFRVGAFP